MTENKINPPNLEQEAQKDATPVVERSFEPFQLMSFHD